MTCDQHTSLVACPHDPDDRTAMGLPHQLVDRLLVSSREYLAGLVTTSPEILADIVEDASQSQPRRFFAGQLLALLGDPRITPDTPAMIDIPAATVSIGLDRQAIDSLEQCPCHQVHVPAFRLMRYPVTNYEYQRFLADTNYWPLPTSWRFGRYPHELANHPVWSISESAASMYASWLSHRLGRRFRLPTEAEWEYAACGGDDREYPWGNTFQPDAANTMEAGPLSTTPVGMYPVGRSLSVSMTCPAMSRNTWPTTTPPTPAEPVSTTNRPSADKPASSPAAAASPHSAISPAVATDTTTNSSRWDSA